jgi:hypothetical protein
MNAKEAKRSLAPIADESFRAAFHKVPCPLRPIVSQLFDVLDVTNAAPSERRRPELRLVITRRRRHDGPV